MDNIDIQRAIENKISLLEKMRTQLQNRAETKAKTSSDYDKAIAICILKLKNGQLMELDGEKIQDPATTIIEKIAKGICWKEKLEMEKGEQLYKALTSSIECVKSELNGLQSIFKVSRDLMR